ncbi:type IV pilus biogenesis protein PilM [Massilia antarctica]|uniref:type IV pilus biogenesis protein PilM n=1 Tax=Massilia antarctica TaxID=2765360 RepID=UPI0006BB7AC4|nr:pilus assembly protein PilM [Massilia sp. H27-R4]MCY0910417.1 pilus assembly protein PilM [Massilia sp. H27-R4]CUI09236.1 MSHA biogenesis protein MshI [Janthinobacterium sp. CG23_2]CUU33022.1 MSHA biogenesis protein MshI [Janthinobacterium sp. CG23_2]
MGFFSKSKKKDGLLAIALQGEGVFAARIKRQAEGLPRVTLASFHPADKGNGPDMLEKTGKDLHASSFRCTTLLGAGEYQLLSVESPNVPADELRTAVRWRLKDMLDFPADQASIDVLDIPTDKAQGRSQSVFAVAARNSLIESRQNRFVDAGVPLSVIDIPEMAQRNISALVEPEGRGVAMLSFSTEGGLLTVTYKGELYLARRIDVTLDQLLDSDHDRKNVCYDKITLELQRSLDHFDRQYNFINVSKLVLAPTGASGLDEYLSSNLYTKVESLDLASVLDLGSVPDLAALAQQQRFFLTLGAALRQEEAAS